MEEEEEEEKEEEERKGKEDEQWKGQGMEEIVSKEEGDQRKQMIRGIMCQ